MASYGIRTSSGGLIELGSIKSSIYGERAILKIDQNANISNGEGEASILLSTMEVKELIGMLNKYIEHVDGIPYVYTVNNNE